MPRRATCNNATEEEEEEEEEEDRATAETQTGRPHS
jgi:hypothetical protein